MNPDRRPLRFASMDEIMPEVDRLLAGHRTVGNWTLGQICGHLASVNRMFVDLPAGQQHDPSLRVSAEQKQQVFTTGQLPEGSSMPPMIQAPEPIGAETGVEQLRESLAYYQASPGPVAEHRRLGPLTKDEWDRLLCIHCAHHLSFAHPQAG